MIRMRLSLITFLIVYSGMLGARTQNPSPQSGPANGPKILVLRGGTLIDGTGGAPVQNAVVVISGGKIQSVGREGEVSVPPGATVLDTSGKTILPGLIDSHIHFRNFHGPLYLYWGVTTVGDMGNARGWILAYRDAIEKGQAIGPHILAVGSKLNAPRNPTDWLAPGDVQGFQTFINGNSAKNFVFDEDSTRRAVAEAKRLGVDGIKLYTRMSPELMKLSAQEAHRNGLPIFAHYTSASSRMGLFLGMDEVLDTGIDVNVHLFGLIKATVPASIREQIARGENIQAWHLMDTSKFAALAQKMVSKNMMLNATLSNTDGDGSKHLKEIDALNTAFLQGPIGAALPEPMISKFRVGYKPAPTEHPEDVEEGFRRAGLFVKEFVAAGGRVIAGADSGAGVKTPGLSLLFEMETLHEAGLTPMQVIQSATKWGAEAWGRSKEIGTLEAGKRADILILNRNPLDDFTAITDISRIIFSGTVIDREGLANWKETIPRPNPMQEIYQNVMIHVPFIDDISPDAVSAKRKKGPELTISGENFTNESIVLINDRLVSPQSHTDKQLRVSIPSSLNKPGTYPLVVVNPGSGGGASNTFFLVVTTDFGRAAPRFASDAVARSVPFRR